MKRGKCSAAGAWERGKEMLLQQRGTDTLRL